MSFSSAKDLNCGPELATPGYTLGPPFFPLGTPTQRVAYFNGHLPFLATQLELCGETDSGTIALDGVVTDRGQCEAHAGCYSYTCDQSGGIITGITQIIPFTATCA
jgi:hypothetical protein